MNKAVSCTGGIGDILKSLSSKDAPCTLATLHRLVHTFMIIIGLVEILRRATKAAMPRSSLPELVFPLFTLIVASVTLANYSPKEFRRSGDNYTSRVIELILVLMYFVPALSNLITLLPEVPVVTPLANFFIEIADWVLLRIRAFIKAIPGGQQIASVGRGGLGPRAQVPMGPQ